MIELNKKNRLSKQKKKAESDSDDSDEENIIYMDSSDEGVRCPACLSNEVSECDWIGCEECPLWWHIECAGREVFEGKTSGELCDETFICDMRH